MGLANWVRLAGLGILLTIAFATGSNLKQAKWDRAVVEALELQDELNDQSDAERKVLNDQVFELQVDLADAELEAERLNDDLQIEINREPVVTTISVSTSDNCPVVQCNIPDVRAHFRLFNCAISNSCKTLPDAGEASISDGAVSRSDSFTFVDGVYGRDNQDRSF